MYVCCHVGRREEREGVGWFGRSEEEGKRKLKENIRPGMRTDRRGREGGDEGGRRKGKGRVARGPYTF